MKPDEIGHAFVFCSKLNNQQVDGLITLLQDIKDNIKDPSITEIFEQQGQSLISFFPIKKLMCKLLFMFAKSLYNLKFVVVLCCSSTYL